MSEPGSRHRSVATLLSLVLLGAAGGAGAARLEGLSSEPYAPGRIVVKLRPDLAGVATRAPEEGFAATSGNAAAASLDELSRRHGVAVVRRVFPGLGDGSARARTAREQVRARLEQRGWAPGAALEARLAAVPDLENVFVFELGSGVGVLEAVAAFGLDDNVAWAEPDWIYTIAAEPLPPVPFVPDDRYVTQDGVTWSQGAFGQDFPDLFGLQRTRAIEGWNQLDTDGSGSFEPGERRPGEAVVVAVIDSGLDASHPDIAANVWVNPGEIPANDIDDDGNGHVDDVSGWDFVDDDADPSDPNGHGTHVAGTIAALAGNAGIGVAGVAPWAGILPLRGLGASGSGPSTGLAAAVDYAVAIGAHVTSNSWGGTGSSQLLDEVFSAAEAAGVLNVAAAGNASSTVDNHFPSNLDSVMAVAALDHDDVRAGFSNFGDKVEISAPGVRVLSLDANGGDNRIADENPDNVVDVDYLQISGTSMATPHVSGAAAVLMSAFPGESAREIRGRLAAGAEPVDDRNPAFAGLLGAGRLDLLGSLTAVPAPLLRLLDTHVIGFRPGHQAQVTVRIRNFWAPLTNTTLELSTDDPNATVDRSQVDLGDLGTGEIGDNEALPFLVSLDPATGFGDIPFTLRVTGDGGFSASFDFAAGVSYTSNVTSLAGVPADGLLPKFLLFQDYSGDARPDLFYADLLTDTLLFRNRGDGTFRLSNARMGVDAAANSWTTLFIDVDNDGDRDVLIGGRVRDGSTLLLNQGDGSAVDISAPSGIGAHALLWAAAIDYDGDGWVDVLGGGGGASGPLVLLRNQGDLSFVDRREESGLPALPFPGTVGGVSTLDYDGDADPDVLLTAHDIGMALWRNEGDGTFTDQTSAAFGAFAPTSLTGVALGDCDNDGDVDLFVSDRRLQDPRSRILLNEGGVFLDAGDAPGDVVAVNLTALFWGNAFLDFDNDGDLDLYVSKDITYGGSELPPVVRNALFDNDGACRFELVSDRAFEPGVSTTAPAAMADYDGDGDVDIYAPDAAVFGRTDGGLLRNELGQDNHWLKVALVGTASARDAYGARVSVEVAGVRQTRELRSSALDSSLAHFGLGAATAAKRVEVRWPSGIVERFDDVAGDRTFSVVEVDCGPGTDTDGDGVCEPFQVAVDVRPRVELARINPMGHGAVPVALLGTERFDVREVTPGTLAFGPAAAAPLPAPPLRIRDVDLDGFEDLVSFYAIPETGIAFGDEQACLSGETLSGLPFEGCDAILTVPGCGLGFELALALPPLTWLHRRRRSARRAS